MLVEAASLAGLPLAKAVCHLWGWCGFAEDKLKAFELLKNIAEETGDVYADNLVVTRR